MSCIPDIETTNRMYDLYQKGKSLAEVAKVFGVNRNSVYMRFKRRDLPLRKRVIPKPYIEFNGERYTLRKCGYFGKTRGNRSYLHRDVWEASNGPIPDEFDIHHIDGDRTNNDLANLELISKAEHASRYGSGQNQYTVAKREAS